MRRGAIAVALFCLGLHVSAAALEPPKPNEKWITLTVDEVQFISDASPAKTLAVARDMLQMRAAIGQTTNLKVRSTLPMRVFLFASERKFAAYRNALLQRKAKNVGGMFASGDTGNFILMPVRDHVDRVVYHELAHYFVQNTRGGLPLWMREGMAEFYSTFQIDEKSVQVGRPIAAHVLWLRNGSMIPLAQLLATTKESPIYNEDERIGVFYAQSWALMHYLLMEPSRRVMLGHFLGHLNSGKSVDEAFAAAFAMKYAQLEQELRGYVGRSTFSYITTPLAEVAIAELPKPEPMSRDALLFELGHLLALAGAANASTAERFLKEALAINPKHAGAHGDLGLVHEIHGRRAEADAEYATAVELGSDDPDVVMQAALILAERYANPFKEPVTRAAVLKVRELFRRVTELDPTRAAAWEGLGATYDEETGDLGPGIGALEKSLELEHTDRRLVRLGLLYRKAGRTADAAKVFERYYASPTADIATKAYLDSVAEQDASESTQARIVASMNAAIAKADAGQYEEALAIVDAILPSIVDPETREAAKKFRDEISAKMER